MKTENARNPRTRWQDSGGGKPGTGDRPPVSAGRVALILLFLLCPIGLILGWLLTLVGSREPVWRRVPGWLVGGVGVAGAVVLLVFGGAHTYATPWRELGEAVAGSSVLVIHATGKAAARPGAVEAVREVAAARWSAWLLAVLPLSVAVALMRTGWVMGRLAWFAPRWRDEDDPELADVPERTRRKVARKDARAVAAVNSSATAFKDLHMSYGVSNEGKPVRLTGEHFLAHLLALGPTGFGKTTTMVRVLYGWLVEWKARKLGAALLDFKGDPDLIDAAAAMCQATGRDLYVVRLTGLFHGYNPLRHGSGEAVISRLIDMLACMADGGFTEPFYRRRGTRWLLGCMAALDNLIEQGAQRTLRDGTRRPWRRVLGDLAALLTFDQLRGRLNALTGEAADRCGDLLDEFDPNPDNPRARAEAMKDIRGMVDGIKLLTETGTGPLLTETGDGVDLEAIIRNGDVVVFSLPAAGNALAAQAVGNLAIADLTATFARLQDDRWAKRTGRRCLVMLDEFGALGGELLVGLFERARSAGGTVLISAQDDANLEEVSPEFHNKVLTNATTHFLHQQYGDGAEAHSKAIGTHKAWKETIQVTEDAGLTGSEHRGSGVGSLRETKAFRVHPDQLKKLQIGESVLFSRNPWMIETVKVTPAPELPAADPRQWLTPAAPPKADEGTSSPAPTVRLVKAPEQPTPEPAETGRPPDADLDGWDDGWDVQAPDLPDEAASVQRH